MDYIFLLDDGHRASALQDIVQSLGCTYICLWCYLPQPSNWLMFMDGFFNEEESDINRPSSSSGSLSRRLFDEYRQLVFTLENDRIPGLAFKNNLPFMELKESDLQSLASVEAQLQFYRTAIFMGCMAGEVEVGMSTDTQMNLETEMRKWIPEGFSKQEPVKDPNFPTDQNRPSSSSSSLRSLSMDSPEYSPFLFKEPPIEQALRPISTSLSPLHQAILSFNQFRNDPIPTPETEDAAITNAILAVLSNPPPPPSSSSSSLFHQPQQNLGLSVQGNYPESQKGSAFKRYRSALAPSLTSMTTRARRSSILKRAFTFFRSLSLMRTQERVQGNRPTTTQLHHMISERKRREKLNESFQALRSLLPPGTKRDKASVLSGTMEHLNSLKAQVMELSRRNRILEAQLNSLPAREATDHQEGMIGASSSTERLDVQITHTAESTSESRIIDLRLILRSGECTILDLATRVLEFLKQVEGLSLMSLEADHTQLAESNFINRLILRLKIEGNWDESAFQEAVRRVVADMAK
ncbi:hypothetical protein U1Q18_018026 [Sarracenia purpurea var. burkii]